MSEHYYMVIDEKPIGPLSLDEIILHKRLTPETLVWKPGVEAWAPAKTFPELAPAFTNHTSPDQSVSPNANPSHLNPNNQANSHGYNSSNPYNQGGKPNPQGQFSHNNYQTNYQNNYRPAFHTNWLPWAIVATVLGLFTSCIGAIFGIIGIVQANKANTFYAQGLEREGDAANSNAKIMTIIGFVFVGLGFIGIICFWSFLGAASGLSYL